MFLPRHIYILLKPETKPNILCSDLFGGGCPARPLSDDLENGPSFVWSSLSFDNKAACTAGPVHKIVSHTIKPCTQGD